MPQKFNSQNHFGPSPLSSLNNPELVFFYFKGIKLCDTLEVNHVLNHIPLEGLEADCCNKEDTGQRVQSIYGYLIFVDPLVSEKKLHYRLYKSSK